MPRGAKRKRRRFRICFELSAVGKRIGQFRLWFSKPVTYAKFIGFQRDTNCPAGEVAYVTGFFIETAGKTE